MSKSKTKPKADKPTRSSGNSLVIVESPAKAKTIAKYLGKGFVVEASMGHVRDLPPSKLGIDLDNKFEPEYKILPTRRKLIDQLHKAADKAQNVYLATDLDREGEAIAWHLAEALNLDRQHTYRVIFNEITSRAINQAFEKPGQIDLDKVNAQQARRILDRLVGYQLSPLLWKKVAKGLSAGRVQSVAVRLVVEREREIEKFIPEESWRICSILYTGPKPDNARSDYEEYLKQCIQKQQEESQEQTAATKQTTGGPDIGDTLNHPKSGEPLKVVDVSDPALVKVRTRFDTDCQIGRKALAQPGDKSAKAPPTPAMPELMQVKPDGKKLKAVFKKHALFKADLVEFDGVAFKASQAQHVWGARSALQDAQYQISSLQSKKTTEKPPAPFTTASLQQQASTRLNLTTKRTMRIAQQLYQGIELGPKGSVGLITYMRTDSRHLSADALSAARSHIQQHFGADYVPTKPNFYASRASAQQAHEAIRPTDVEYQPDQVKQFLTAEQFRLYDLIWRRFVACQMKPALWNVSEAWITATANKHTGLFKASGRILAFPGFLAVLPSRLESADAMLPELAEDQLLKPVCLNTTQHFTQPPPRFTEASLVRTLEAEGIGRPSTYAAIISTIQDRGYSTKEKGKFYPSDLGMMVTDQLVQHFPKIMDVKFTSHMEGQLDKIEEAHLDWVAVLNEFYEPFKEALEQANQNMTKESGQESPYTCKECQKPMVYRWTKTGRFLACSGYPQCKYSCSIDNQGKPIEKQINHTSHKCPKCQKPMVLRSSRYGHFLGCSEYPQCKQTIPCDQSGNLLKTVKPDQLQEPCDQCGKMMNPRRFRGTSFLGCAGYPECKNTKPIPKDVHIEWPGPKLTDIKCSKCGKPMVQRISRRGPFLGCSGYPKCKQTQSVEDKAKTQDKAKTKSKSKDKKEDKKKATAKSSSDKK